MEPILLYLPAAIGMAILAWLVRIERGQAWLRVRVELLWERELAKGRASLAAAGWNPHVPPEMAARLNAAASSAPGLGLVPNAKAGDAAIACEIEQKLTPAGVAAAARTAKMSYEAALAVLVDLHRQRLRL